RRFCGAVAAATSTSPFAPRFLLRAFGGFRLGGWRRVIGPLVRGGCVRPFVSVTARSARTAAAVPVSRAALAEARPLAPRGQLDFGQRLDGYGGNRELPADVRFDIGQGHHIVLATEADRVAF